ncbi:TrmJ/YjtD family RNA methyltransferase [Candidatus Woesearchaeota archaeon]|nr:TrmJ/YjtD family RNA methyltransferase [Candidatus Woesearchaeota archaeon]
MITVILIEPENSGNVGAVARAMANFDLKDLVLINPKCRPLSEESRKRAKHAQEILRKAKVKDWKYLKHLDCLIATTSQLGTDYNIPRSPLSSRELADKIKGKKARYGIVFGREGIGLTNEEILMCDYVVRIPSSKRYPTLNLSHAACILFYEIFRKKGEKELKEKYPLASAKEKRQVLRYLEKALSNMDFATEEKKQTQVTVWKRVLGKSNLTKREVFALMGFLRKL